MHNIRNVSEPGPGNQLHAEGSGHIHHFFRGSGIGRKRIFTKNAGSPLHEPVGYFGATGWSGADYAAIREIVAGKIFVKGCVKGTVKGYAECPCRFRVFIYDSG